MTKVFISSTVEDLKLYRAAAVEALVSLGYLPIAMEYFGPMGVGATAASQQRLRESDLYVGIFAHRYGYVEPGYDRSVTEMEFDYAGECHIERLCFVADPEHAWPPKWFEDSPPLRDFHKRIEESLVHRTFTTVDDFRAKLTLSLFNHAVAQVHNGLNALSQILPDEQVRRAVRRFRKVFSDTGEHFIELKNHKLAHDALHELQFQCYAPVVAASRWPFDESAWYELDRYESGLLEVLDRLDRQYPKRNDDSLWMADLRRARLLFRRAIERRDLSDRDESVDILKRVLDVVPATINSRLTAATQAIRPAALAQALESIKAQLDQLRLHPQVVKQLESSIVGLANVIGRLLLMADRHDQWQQLDSVLRMVNSTLRVDATDLETCWPEIARLMAMLLTSKSDRLARLAEAHAELDQELAKKDLPTVRLRFDTLRATAGLLFHSTDQDLKRACDDLMSVGQPMAAILAALDQE